MPPTCFSSSWVLACSSCRRRDAVIPPLESTYSTFCCRLWATFAATHRHTFQRQDRELSKPKPLEKRISPGSFSTESCPDSNNIHWLRPHSFSAPMWSVLTFQQHRDTCKNSLRNPGQCTHLPQPSPLLAPRVPGFFRYLDLLQFQSPPLYRGQHQVVCPG